MDATSKENAYKLPVRRKTEVFSVAHYRIIDEETGTIIVPFDKITNSTRIDTDADGMYISFLTAGLPKGRSLTVEALFNDRGIERLVKLKDISFTVI